MSITSSVIHCTGLLCMSQPTNCWVSTRPGLLDERDPNRAVRCGVSGAVSTYDLIMR